MHIKTSDFKFVSLKTELKKRDITQKQIYIFRYTVGVIFNSHNSTYIVHNI